MSRDLIAELQQRYGDAPLVARVLAARPEVAVPGALKNSAILRNSPLGDRVAELVAIGAAAALRCEHCLNVHVKQALRAGASEEELLSAMLIAGVISESSTQAYAFRALDRAKRDRAAEERENTRGK
ncbi:MAG: carboxymuconolactone decarboxylase family protein [Dehalococcoidia bacterium]